MLYVSTASLLTRSVCLAPLSAGPLRFLLGSGCDWRARGPHLRAQGAFYRAGAAHIICCSRQQGASARLQPAVGSNSSKMETPGDSKVNSPLPL